MGLVSLHRALHLQFTVLQLRTYWASGLLQQRSPGTRVVYPAATSKAVPGLQAKVYAHALPAVTTTSLFGNFGEYAPDERYIIVPQEDRKVTVA